MADAPLNVSVPSAQAPGQLAHHGSQTHPAGARSAFPYRVFPLVLTLLPRPLIAPLIMIAQEVESTTWRGVHDLGLGRMKLPPFGFPPPLHLDPSRLGFGWRAALDDEVVGLARHGPTLLGHPMVQRVEVDVGSQRTDD
jgi:hypothetical protein